MSDNWRCLPSAPLLWANSNFLKILFKKNNENKNFVLANSSKNNFCSSKSSKRTLNWNTSKKNVTIQGKKLFHEHRNNIK